MNDQDRIDQLASQVRRLRWMNYGLAAVVAAGAMLAAGALQQVSPIVKAKRIEIVAADGKTVLALSSDPAGGMLRAFNAEGQELVELSAGGPSGGHLITRRVKGEASCLIGATSLGGMIVAFNDSQTAVAQLQAGHLGGSLFIGSNLGHRQATLNSEALGGTFTTYNRDGQPMVRLSVSAGDRTELLDDYANGKRRSPRGTITTLDADGKKTADLP